MATARTRSALRRRPLGSRRVAAAIVQVPAAASVAARHVARDPWKAVSVGLRAVGPLRSLARLDAVRRVAPLTAAVADAAAGDRERAHAALRGLAVDGPVDRLSAVAAVCAVLDQPALAALAVERMPAGGPALARVRALRAWSDGRLGEAVDLAAGLPGPRGRALHRTLAAELRVMRAEEVSALPSRGAPPSRERRAARDTAGSAGQGGPRALHVVTNALPEVQAGYTIRTQGITRAQRAAGIDAHVVTRLGFPVDSGRRAPALDFVHDGVPTHRLVPPLRLPVALDDRIDANVDRVAALAERLDVDVLHAHSKHENGQIALRAGARLGLPVVYEARGFLEETWRSRGGDAGSDFYRLSRAAETACMRAADAVVAVSRAMVDDIVGRGIDPGKVRLVGNCVSSDFLAPAPDASALRSRLGLGPESVAVGVVSTLNDYEGLDVLVEAVARVDDPRLVLVVVGDGPARSDLERLAARLLPGRAVFTGRVPHAAVREHHAALDVFCVPRRRTPVTELVPPLKPLEAMATARPLVVSDLPPLLELVGDEDAAAGSEAPPRQAAHGLVAAADDPGSWAESLRVLLYDPALRQRLGRTAREWVREQRTWDAAARTYGDLYSEVMNASGDHARARRGSSSG